MRKVNRLGMIAVLAVGTVVGPAFAGNVTVGRFYTELAQAKHLVSVDAASAEANLRGAGYNLPKLALDKSLTEGDVASISHSVGLPVTTQRPSQLITETQMNTFMSSFGRQINVAQFGGSNPAELYGAHHGDHDHTHDHEDNHHDHHRSTSEPD